MTERQKLWELIMSQWLEKFPFLKQYGASRLYYRTDIFLIGIWLEKGGYGISYEPNLVVKPLWSGVSNSSENCLCKPLYTGDRRRYWKDIDNKTDLKQHDLFFKRYNDNPNPLYDQVLNGIISYDWIYKEAVHYFTEKNKYHEYYFYDNWMFMELMLALSLYFEDSVLMRKATKAFDRFIWQSEKRLKNDNLMGIRGPGVVDWYEHFKRSRIKIFDSRESLMAVCERNSKLKKITTLNKGEMVDSPPL
ncbi:MAG: hypothetical protein K2F94_02745, partial [Muribaculaceae bacterium]|nr:hypothetical protein [Muribaculaceae bacterium]